jgi:hypothetical protein
LDLHFSVKHLSFMTGKYPMSIVALADGRRWMCLSIFPIVRYTGHACLSPLKAMRLVLSLAWMMGDIVAPSGKSSYSFGISVANQPPPSIPYLCVLPPAPSCHFIPALVGAIIIFI